MPQPPQLPWSPKAAHKVRRDLLDMALPQTPMILHRGGRLWMIMDDYGGTARLFWVHVNTCKYIDSNLLHEPLLHGRQPHHEIEALESISWHFTRRITGEHARGSNVVKSCEQLPQLGSDWWSLCPKAAGVRDLCLWPCSQGAAQAEWSNLGSSIDHFRTHPRGPRWKKQVQIEEYLQIANHIKLLQGLQDWLDEESLTKQHVLYRAAVHTFKVASFASGHNSIVPPLSVQETSPLNLLKWRNTTVCGHAGSNIIIPATYMIIYVYIRICDTIYDCKILQYVLFWCVQINEGAYVWVACTFIHHE